MTKWITQSCTSETECGMEGTMFLIVKPGPSMGLLLGSKGYDQSRQHIKSRDINLPTKVHVVKAMVFPVVMYGCEIWTIKKAEH